MSVLVLRVYPNSSYRHTFKPFNSLNPYLYRQPFTTMAVPSVHEGVLATVGHTEGQLTSNPLPRSWRLLVSALNSLDVLIIGYPG